MPAFKPIGAPKPQTRKLVLACVAAFIFMTFLFAFLINSPEWR
jgi:hypothetical protein